MPGASRLDVMECRQSLQFGGFGKTSAEWQGEEGATESHGIQTPPRPRAFARVAGWLERFESSSPERRCCPGGWA